eukprot:gene14176-16712_t
MERELKTKNEVNKLATDFRFVTHMLTPQDTLAGLALKYGSKVADIKRVNKIWTQDSLFLRKSLMIPIEKNEDCDEGSSSSSSLASSSGVSPSSSSSSSSSGNNSFNTSNSLLDSNPFNHTFVSKQNDFFSEFNNKSNYNLNNVLNKPKAETQSWKSVPISTLSLSPVVNSLDEKTQNQFSLIDDELNPL